METREISNGIIKANSFELPWPSGTVADVNTCFKTGVYYVSSATLNRPEGATYGILEVTNVADLTKQVFTNLANYCMLVRIKNQGVAFPNWIKLTGPLIS